MSISNRLIAIVVSINVAILLVVTIIATLSSNIALRTQTLARFATKHTGEVRILDAVFQNLYNTVEDMVGGLEQVVDLNDSAQVRDYLRQSIARDADILIHRIGVVRPDGSAGILFIPNPSVADFYEWRVYRQQRDLPHDPHLDTAQQDNTPVWFQQPVAQYDVELRPVMSLAFPYTTRTADGDFRGILWVDVSLATLTEIVRDTAADQGLLADTIYGYSLLVDNDGNLITALGVFGAAEARDPENLTADLIARLDAANRTSGMFTLYDPVREVPVLANQAIFAVNNWQFISILPEEEIASLPLQILVPTIFVALFGIVLVAWVMRRFIERVMIRPLLNLGSAAQEIGSGDLRYIIAHQGQADEMGALARALESMKTNIAHSYEQLSRWSRTLEERVIQRTRELEEARRQANASADEIRAVYDETLLVVTETQLGPVLNAFTNRITTLLKASYCAVWLLNDDKDRLQLVATTVAEDQDRGISIGSTEGLAGQTIQAGEPIRVMDYRVYPQRVIISERELPFVRAVCVPLVFVGRNIGAVVVGRGEEAPPFNDQDVHLLSLFANLVSPSVRNAQLYVRTNVAVREAERANQVKTRFLASVTHELRTPLNLIINNMDFMRIGAFGDVTEEQIMRLNQTTRSAEHLLYLINDLLDVSKIDAGEMQLFIQENAVYTLLEDTLDNAHAFMEKIEGKVAAVELVANIDKDIPELPMDARRIRQVLTNLLSNAIKFTSFGEVRLTVKKEAEGVRFSVRDSGIGISPEEVGKLFAAFERTRQAKESNIEGTGLGLAISQFLVQEHGGEIFVESTEGKGSEFWFVLPYEIKRQKRRSDTRLIALLTSQPE